MRIFPLQNIMFHKNIQLTVFNLVQINIRHFVRLSNIIIENVFLFYGLQICIYSLA